MVNDLKVKIEMTRRSLTNKSPSSSWYFCELCRANITSKSRDTHENVCPIAEEATYAADASPLEYIRDGALFTADLKELTDVIPQLKELPAKFCRNLIFLSEGAIRLADFHIGQNVQVIIKSTNGTRPPVVRSIWPLSEKYLTTVFVTNHDYKTNWSEAKDCVYSIQALPRGSVSLAKTVRLKIMNLDNDQILSEHQLKDALRLLKMEMTDLIYTTGSEIKLNFFNIHLKFQIKSWNRQYEELPNDGGAALENVFASLSLDKSDDKFKELKFLNVTHNTQLEYENEEETEAKSAQTGRQTLIGGLDEQLRIIRESMNLALGISNAPKGIKISRGMLLYGSSGCGKSLICDELSKKVLDTCKCKVIKINASEIFSKYLGETEKNLNAYFEQAYQNYPQPSLIIVEDVNNLCPKDKTNVIYGRVSMAFAGLLDALNSRIEARSTFLLATTSDIEAVCSSLRRCGRLDLEVEIGAPAPKARAEILQCALQNVNHSLTAADVQEVAQITHGFVGADLVNLISHATLTANKNGQHEIKVNDMVAALTYVKPSAMREVLIENPNVFWSDIGGQTELKLQLKQAIEWPLLYPEKLQRLGIKPPRGILMYGPPGCSKTMIAKALATESRLNFLSIKGPELFSMWVGESERAVREVFRKARQVAPAIVFFDEIDAIGGERAESGASGGGGSSVQERVLTQLLTELDGVEALQNVTIVAATNRPDMIDKALLRPGRIDRIVYVSLPDAATRRDIFRIKLAKMPVAADVDIEILVERTAQYSGAEIQAICHEAALKTLQENLDASYVSWSHFEYALEAVKPRTSPDLLRLYEEYAGRH